MLYKILIERKTMGLFTRQTTIDFSKYVYNNFKITEKNEIINIVGEKNKEVFLLSSGKIGIKNRYSKVYKEYSISQAELVLTNITGHPVKIEKKKSIEDVEEEPFSIHISELKLVEEQKFSPHVLAEYYEEEGLVYINTFHPTSFLTLKGQYTKEPMTILNFIRHIVNYDEQRFWYFIQWLAAFIQSLKKSQVSILFKGTQGAGKGILFSIIQTIFGGEYCKQINGDSLSSNYLGSFIEDTLFINFDEVNYNTIGKRSFNSFLKALITNEEITAEKKNQNMSGATKIYAQVLLFSNSEYPIEIEPNDRRFTVFTTGQSLVSTNFLNYGSYKSLKDAIDNELQDFVLYLKQIFVNNYQVNSVFNTPEKNAMINASLDNLPAFTQAILNLNNVFFNDLQYENLQLYIDIQNDFYQGKINRANIAKAYNALYPSKKISSRDLLNKMRAIHSVAFSDANMFHSGSKHFYRLANSTPYLFH